jgi:hypothetical protein
MSKRKINIFDKIGKLIPGYTGYSFRDEKRNTDKKTRTFLAVSIQQSENLIIQHQKELINKNDIQKAMEWDNSRKMLNTLFYKIQNTSYGESSFFSENQIKEEELDEIHSSDLAMTERILLISKTVQEEINEPLSIVFVLQQISEVENLLIKRLNFINQYK